MSAESAIPPSPAAPGATVPVASLQDAATLKALRRRTVFLLLILLPAIVLTVILVIAERRPLLNSPVAAQAIPANFSTGDRVWTSSEMKFSDLEMDILETHDYVFRTYTDGTSGPNSGPIDLCVVFSEDNRKGTHPPDVCLEASGCHIINRMERTIDIGGEPLTVREIVTTRAGSDQYLYFAYFYKCGDTFTPSFYRQQVQLVWNGLTRQNTAGALLRYSTPMAKLDDLSAARARTDELIVDTYPYLKKNLNARQ